MAGGSQLFTGGLSNHVGQVRPNVLGMWIYGAVVAMIPLGDQDMWWSLCAGIAGFRMAARSAIHFWRDLGYCIGALVLGWRHI